MPSSLCPLCTLLPGIFTAHTRASLSHETSLTCSKVKLLGIQDGSHRTLYQAWDPCESRALWAGCMPVDLAPDSVLFGTETGSAEDVLN